MVREEFLTAEGFKNLELELEDLKVNKRAEISEQIKIAREFGDLSENAEYDAAKEEQGKIEARIYEVEYKLKNAKIIDQNVKSEKIMPGSTVVIHDKTYDEKETYTVVGVAEADPTNNKISNESPIGAALIGRKKGDIINVHTPGGVVEIKIIDVK